MIIESKTDIQLIELIKSADRLALPMSRRFEGDDDDIVALMTEMGLTQGLVHKLLIQTLVMREALARGLHIPRGN